MIYRALFYTLLTVPLFFKIQVLPGIVVLPQDLVLIALLLSLPNSSLKIHKLTLPFFYLITSLTIILIVTIFSQFFALHIVGVLTTIKYLIYTISVAVLINNREHLTFDIEKAFLKFSFYAVALSLGIYFFKFISSDLSWQVYISRTTWWHEYMPTGLSNRVFNFTTWSFDVSRGNHGIWGSFLSLILFIAIRKMIITRFKNCKLLVVLTIVNLSLITAREAYLLIFVFLFSYGVYKLLNAKFNRKVFTIFFISILLITGALIYTTPDITILRKFKWMFQSISEGNFDPNIMVRVNTWYLYILYTIYNPLIFFTGVGFNKDLFSNALYVQEQAMGSSFFYGLVPESFYITTLAYGGVFSLIFGVMFFAQWFFVLYKYNSRTKLFSFFVLGYVLTNATGSSILAELLLSQIGIVMCILTKEHEK